MQIGGLVLPLPFDTVSPRQIVRDGRTLRGMIRQGLIKDPKYGALPQIDGELGPAFTYRGAKYKVKYFDGSIYPFVVRI